MTKKEFEKLMGKVEYDSDTIRIETTSVGDPNGSYQILKTLHDSLRVFRDRLNEHMGETEIDDYE